MGFLDFFSKKEPEQNSGPDPFHAVSGESSHELFERLRDHYKDTDTERYLEFFRRHRLEDLPGKTDANSLAFYLSARRVRHEENKLERIHLYPVDQIEPDLLDVGFNKDADSNQFEHENGELIIRVGIDSDSDTKPVKVTEKDGRITQLDTVRYSGGVVREIRYEIAYSREKDVTIYENIDNRVKSLLVFDSEGRRHNSKGPARTEYSSQETGEEISRKYYWRGIYLGEAEEGASALDTYVNKARTPAEEKSALDQRNEEILKGFQ